MNKHQVIAVLITCHNRKEKTLSCLKSLFSTEWPKKVLFHVYLVDDGSTDGTDDAVKLNFPEVNVIKGNGNLYWNKGMRLAWETAAQNKEYDFYLWLNDDTLIDEDAVCELLNCSKELKKYENNASIIVGTCRNAPESSTFSYGGRNHDVPVIPNGSIQKCNFINGNLVLVPKEIYNKIGNLSPHYTHAMGDNDYGLRALKAGFGCFITRKYVATCPTNKISDWCNPKIPVAKRFQNLYSPKGLNIKEYIIFLKEHKRKKWFFFTLKVYLKTLFPNLYNFLTAKFSSQMT
jgi:GT2 family glycosyltransferase